MNISIQMGDSRIVIPVLASILILGTLGLSQDALAYDVCSDDDRCAHETMTRYGVEVYNNNTDTDLTTGQLELLEEGAGHEDVWDHLFAHQDILGLFEDILEIGATITMGHFWDPDQRKFCLDPLCISPLSADYIDDYDPDRDIILDGAAKFIMDAVRIGMVGKVVGRRLRCIGQCRLVNLHLTTLTGVVRMKGTLKVVGPTTIWAILLTTLVTIQFQHTLIKVLTIPSQLEPMPLRTG
jgi:hypothetical protein